MKILVVDDDEVARLLLRHVLTEQFECTVLEAQNGREGLSIVRKEAPDLVFLDVSMPVMDGVRMLKILRSDASHAELPVVILSAISEKPIVMQMMTLGISDYLLKPLDLETVVQRIEKIISTITPHKEENGSDMMDDSTGEVNPKALAFIRKLGGDKLVEELIESFLSHVPSRLEATRRGIVEEDAPAIAIAVHTLKSSCGQLGAVAMQTLCEEAELLADQKNISIIPPVLEKIESEFHRVKIYLEDTVSRMKEGT